MLFLWAGMVPADADPGPVLHETSAPGQHPAFAGQTNAPPPARSSRYRVTLVAHSLERPWGLAFLPDGRLLVTERPGRMKIVNKDTGALTPVTGVPAVHVGGQGGLLDLALDPDFANNGLVYFTYFEPQGDKAGLAVGRARIDWQSATPSLGTVQVIFRAQPLVPGEANVGSRLLFGRDGMLYVTVGDRYEARDQAQDLSSDLGKLIRIAPDGSAPKDNPFVNTPGARPEIYALGQRDAEGLAMDPETGALWELENGPKGGDELNLIKAGANYGWPVITYGRDYSDAPLGVGTAADGMVQPVYYWDPSIAPSGFAIYDGALSAAWRGNIFVTALKGQRVSRLVMKNGHVAAEEQILGELKSRIRDVEEGPDGALYVLTDQADGRIMRVVPVETNRRIARRGFYPVRR